MSAPFDPTKLDLDINKKNIEKKTLPIQKKSEVEDVLGKVEIKVPEIKKEQETKKEAPQPKADILNEITITSDSKVKPPLPPIEEEKGDKDINGGEKKLIDINVESLESIITLIDEKQYDYALVEPEDMQVKITFRQDNIDKDIKYVKFPVYTNILFKIKQVAKLEVETTGTPQEGKGETTIGTKRYKLAAKTVPGQNGERVWIKTKEDTSQKGKKKVKKTSASMIFGFLGAILFVSLVLGGAFIAFIVLNAKTVEDVKFFASLGINLNDINTFISQIVSLIFSILLFLSTVALSFALFKFFLTKKIFKRKKVVYGLLSTFLLMITFATGSAWMVIDGKIKGLPNWQEQAYGDLKIFDNDLLISKDFAENQALVTKTQDLIGPMTLKFDLENFQNNQARKGLSIQKYIWDFGDEVVETFSPTITKVFNVKRNYEISVRAIGKDPQGEEVEQLLSNIPAVSISHLIDVQETITNNGGKKLSFDANDLKNLGKIEWYFKQAVNDQNSNPDYPEWTRIDEGYEFIPGRIFFEEIFVGLSIINGKENEASIDKVIVISPDADSEISGEIDFTQDIENELSFDFRVKDASTNFANGFIENYQWTIENKTYSVRADLETPNISPKVQHTFKEFGPHNIQVILTDSKGKSQTISKTITIGKSIELRSALSIFDEDENELTEVRYEKKAHEYYIDALGVPAELKFDARYVRPNNIIYSLESVTWDIGANENIDGKGKSFDFNVPTEGNHNLLVKYHFVHRKNKADTIDLEENIYIEGIKKEAILSLKIEKDSNYAPVTVRFDASKSFIKNDDIIKFVYDYGDGETEERDAINPGHKYGKAGDYTVKLTVIGNTGKTYSIEKKLILLPPPQEVKISASLKKAPTGQGIDFSSAKSEGQIVEYFWDFGDGNISTQANPTHSYKNEGNYKVTLKVDFTNKNSITDKTEIEIFEEK